MKRDAIVSPTSLSVWVIRESEGAPLEVGFVELGAGDVPGEYLARQPARLVTVRLKNPRQGEALLGMFGCGRARLATVDQVAPNGAALVTVRLFNGAVVEIGDVDIGLDERAQASARQLLGLRHASIEVVLSTLRELCTFETGPGAMDRFFLLTTGAARDFEGDEQGDAAAPVRATTPDERAFCVQGDGVRMAVVRQQPTPDEARHLATRLTSSLGGEPDGSLRLARGRLTFSDTSRTGRIQALAAGAMARLMKANNGYLRKWDEYGALEGKLLLERARRVGVLRWHAVDLVPHGEKGVRFFFHESLKGRVAAGDVLELCEQEPDYIKQLDLTWADYSSRLESRVLSSKKSKGKTRAAAGDAEESPGQGAMATVREVGENNSLVLDLPASPNRADLCLVLSLAGDRAQIERRMDARRRILEGRSANPMLGVIIEENGELDVPPQRTSIRPLTAFVQRKLFTHPPTPRQIEAIDIALNTPDIALIQGPPGTGKTTVIAAIVERLNELADRGQSMQGEVLISAYQHDAIENMMARLTVNSLPVPKFGQRSGQREIGDRNAESLQRWCRDLADRVRQHNPGLDVTSQLRDAQLRCHDYVLAPSLDNAISTIDAFLALPGGRLSEPLIARARALRVTLEHERSGRALEPDSELLREVWSLRTSAEGFLDDGPVTAQGLLLRLGATLPADARQRLEQAAAWTETSAPPFLSDLRRLKGELIGWYRPRASFRIDKPRRDVLEIVQEAECELVDGATSDQNQVNRILSDFLHQLENDPTAAQRAVEEYGFAFAATCQASQGSAIQRRKERSSSMGGARDYDTVIVDEAARTSPRDLLIPMSQARRRIILVGDHRQLPHMINEEIARALEGDPSDPSGEGERGGESTLAREADFVRQSMFQYLFTRLKQLEKRDNIPRCVTLDQQFRMHPLLGQFVSDQFYRVHDEKEAFGSPLPAESFYHHLPGIREVPALWLDLPAAAGEETRAGTSRRRSAEAQLIAAQIKRWIDTPEGRRLTFGVISFYSAQVDAVLASLASHQLATREADGWRIAEDYRLRPTRDGAHGEEQLRVGTVDSFQGMEFDVVFLSMVRSKTSLPSRKTDQAGRSRWVQSVYGHLTSPNRLCVSMSRQKRLLVVVGDRAMLDHEEARRELPGLVAFRALCEQHGQVRAWEPNHD